MTLYVHHGPRLDTMADELVGLLAVTPDDPFTADVVAVPTAGLRDLVIRSAARRLGVSANIEFPFPGRFVAEALGSDPSVPDPWQLDPLTWAVLEVLEAGRVAVPGWEGATRPRRSRRFAVARRIAELFDRYGAIRPELLQQWAAGTPGDGIVRAAGAAPEPTSAVLDSSFRWQFQLWREVRDLLGTPSPAERLPELLATLRDDPSLSRLPERVSWFGVDAMPAPRLAVLDALAVHREVHLWVGHPSIPAWDHTPPQPAGWLLLRRRFEELTVDEAPAGHPLLRSWGRAAAELAALATGLAGRAGGEAAVVAASIAGDDPGADAAAPTLLRHVQADLAADRAPTPFAGDPADCSLQVHTCHGPTRQLEVLRDVLGHLFVADPTLAPRDVVVLCPDLERFQPFAEGIFARGELPVPVVVTDLSLGTENPVARALLTILGVLAGRHSALDLLSLATLDPVRRRLGFSADDLDRITTWIGAAGTSWGLDAAHRLEVLDPAGEPLRAGDLHTWDGGTWDATLRALLVGAAVPAPEARAIGEVVPFDDMPAESFATAGRLAELVATVARLRDRCRGEHTVEAWCDVLGDAVGALCATEPADAWQLAEVVDAIDGVRTAAVGRRVVLAAEDVSSLVGGLLNDYRGRLRLRSGAVTITGLAPLRNVPARVVCLLGFDEAGLRAPGTDGDDLLGQRSCVGEPDGRTERRQVVLDALLAARDHLVVVCDGNDVTTNRRLRFAVALSELLDVVDASLPRIDGDAPSRGDRDREPSRSDRDREPRSDDGDSPIVRRHRLRSYDEADFRAEAPFGFDAAMVRAASVRRRAAAAPTRDVAARWALPATVDVAADVTADPTVTLAELVGSCSRPARTLLRDRLDVRLPGDLADVDTSIPLAVSPLDTAALGRRLLDRCRSAAAACDPAAFDRQSFEAAVLDEWTLAESLAGRLPPGDLVRQSLDEISRELFDLVAAAVKAVSSRLGHLAILGASGTLDIDIGLAPDGAPPLRVVDRLGAIADAGPAGSALCRLTYTRPKSRTYVESVLHLAAAVVATGRTDWLAITATRGSSRTSRPIVAVVGPAGLAEAQRLLDAAATVRVAALSGAVPLFEEASRALYETRVLDDELLVGSDYQRGDLDDLDTGFVWAGATSADVLRLGPRAWADRLWGAIDDFVVDWSPSA